WLQVRPGTDAVLGLGLIREILRQNRYNHAFVREWTNAPLLVRSDTGDFVRASELDGSIHLSSAKSSDNSKGLSSPRAASKDGHQNDTFTDSAWVVWDAHGQQPMLYDTQQNTLPLPAEHLALSGAYELTLNGQIVICHPVFELLQ